MTTPTPQQPQQPQPNGMQFSLFQNTRKTNERHPDLKMAHSAYVTITVPGTYKIACWERTARNSGERYLSGSLVPVDTSTLPPRKGERQDTGSFFSDVQNQIAGAPANMPPDDLPF